MEFLSKYPTPSKPALPEYFRPQKIESMLPGEMIFPYAFTFHIDSESHTLHINALAQLTSDATDPDFFDNKVGLMRVYEGHGNDKIDGYIADFRHIKPGSIEYIVDVAHENQRLDHANWTPLLAAVFTDPDGQPHYMGDKRVVSSMESLMHTTDAHVATFRMTDSTNSDPVSDVKPTEDRPEFYIG